MQAHQELGGNAHIFQELVYHVIIIQEEYAAKCGNVVGEIDGEIHLKMAKLVLKTFKEVKPHSSEESEDKVVEGERDNDDNDEHVCYFLMGRSVRRSTPPKVAMWWGRLTARYI